MTVNTTTDLQQPPLVVEMRGIVKRFPGVTALKGVDFDARAGEIHALLGANGAGKSTLMKILYGLYQPNEGEILLDGKAVSISSPLDFYGGLIVDSLSLNSLFRVHYDQQILNLTGSCPSQ